MNLYHKIKCNEKIFANFTGRIVEVCAQQGAVVNKGDVIAYLERTEFTA